jgi:5-formyltetrahydrofolate cyclo-ligase
MTSASLLLLSLPRKASLLLLFLGKSRPIKSFKVVLLLLGYHTIFNLQPMLKSELRKVYREKRLLLTATERMKMDDLLLIQFQKLSLDNLQVLLSYSSSDKHAEPNTYLFSTYLEHMIPGLQLCYPVTDFMTLTMKAVEVNDLTDFDITEFGIEEPVNGIEIDPHEIDVVFVPMLICDKAGFRVGFGKGFYDRFLSLCRADVLKVGFSYFEPVDAINDTHQFDIPLDFCITPEKVYQF